MLKKISPIDADLDLYRRIRKVLEELGPTFIKFGQIMSLRPDLLPEELLHELEKLQDDVTPVSYNEIEQVVVDSLGPQPVNTFRYLTLSRLQLPLYPKFIRADYVHLTRRWLLKFNARE